jgi:hypothetical protein
VQHLPAAEVPSQQNPDSVVPPVEQYASSQAPEMHCTAALVPDLQQLPDAGCVLKSISLGDS